MNKSIPILLVVTLVMISGCDVSQSSQSDKTDTEKSSRWKKEFYVDKFGDKTSSSYVTNGWKISGSLRNSATNYQLTDVQFLISDARHIAIVLIDSKYTYTSLKSVQGNDSYTVDIKDKDGKEYELGAVNYSDRLEFSETNSSVVNEILGKGGSARFLITNDRTPTTQYSFDVYFSATDGDTYRKLLEKS